MHRLTADSSGGSIKSQSVWELSNEVILRPHSSPHDVILVATVEGHKEIKCHKCILVTRSGQLQIIIIITFIIVIFFLHRLFPEHVVNGLERGELKLHFILYHFLFFCSLLL